MNQVRMIYYLAHPWKFHPNQSFTNAVNWTCQLRRKGLVVFSPILHTHPYWERVMSERSLEYIKNENWLEWDLALMEGMMNHDGTKESGKCSRCGRPHPYKKNFWCLYCDGDVIKIPKKSDSGITMLMSKTAFKSDPENRLPKEIYEEFFHLNIEDWQSFWHSQGCRQEYEFAKEHFIQIFELEAFLNGEEKEL